MDYARCQAMTDDELELLKEGDVPAILATHDPKDDINRVDDIDAEVRRRPNSLVIFPLITANKLSARYIFFLRQPRTIPLGVQILI